MKAPITCKIVNKSIFTKISKLKIASLSSSLLNASNFFPSFLLFSYHYHPTRSTIFPVSRSLCPTLTLFFVYIPSASFTSLLLGQRTHNHVHKQTLQPKTLKTRAWSSSSSFLLSFSPETWRRFFCSFFIPKKIQKYIRSQVKTCCWWWWLWRRRRWWWWFKKKKQQLFFSLQFFSFFL